MLNTMTKGPNLIWTLVGLAAVLVVVANLAIPH
jgi:hypothetical protein